MPAGVAFNTPGPARFWLFTLKALAFISLRSGRTAETACLLERIAELDPLNSVGGDVIEALLRSAADDRGLGQASPPRQPSPTSSTATRNDG